MSAALGTGGQEETVGLRRFLDHETVRVETALQEVAEPLLDEMSGNLRAAVRYALETRGKRLRPILCCAAFRAIRGREPGQHVYRMACAVEMVHTYSLVHDDLPCMDDDDVRRGRPAVHRAYGTTLAIAAGAALLPLAIRLLDAESEALGLAPRERARLVSALCDAAGATGMVGGQLLDLEAEDAPPDAAGLERIHRAKTGALLAASLRIGAMAAGASDDQLAAVTDYGDAVGLAFQITDDILDVVADSNALGKTAGRDESLGKATYPSLFGLKGARKLAAEWADHACSALARSGIDSPELRMLARYAVQRDR